MIGRLAGRVLEKGTDYVLLDVQGVGYIVHCSERVLASLPPVGEAAALYTDLLVREDLLQLFGFTTRLEKEWHKLLLSVQGVGAKAALAIMGALGAEGVARAITLGDWNSIAKAKGIGPKTAQRVVMELKGKAPAVMALGGGENLAEVLEDEVPAVAEAVPAAKRAPRKKDDGSAAKRAQAQADALSALSNLGYSPSDAAQAVAQAGGENPEAEASGLIRAALRLLAPKD